MKIKTPEQYRARQERRKRLAENRKYRSKDVGKLHYAEFSFGLVPFRTQDVYLAYRGKPNHAERVTNAPQAHRSDSPYLPRYIGKGHHRTKRCERYSGGCQRPTAHKGKCGARSQSETLIYGEVKGK